MKILILKYKLRMRQKQKFTLAVAVMEAVVLRKNHVTVIKHQKKTKIRQTLRQPAIS